VIPKKVGGRKAWKELKTKMLKSRGKEKSKIYYTRKTDKGHEIRKQKADYLKEFVGK
jgi:small subunit ribosomal protein S24e